MSTGAASRPPGGADDVTVRAATSADHRAIIGLAGAALGWQTGEPHDELFRWKHLDNAFGPSAMWVAEERGELVAFRAMMRWRFRRGDSTVSTVRAVDTATHPDHQGRGLFRRLTMHAVEALQGEDVAFVFNTPNAKSRPGYLKMGWQVVGRVPVGVRVASIGSFTRLARARVPAGKWSLETNADEPALTVLTDTEGLRDLMGSLPTKSGIETDRSVAFLQWRYGGGPVRYRVALRGNKIQDGLVFYRMRARGSAIEATVADVLMPTDDAGEARRLIDRVVRTSGADYAIHGQRRLIDGGHVRLAGQGPILTWRGLTEPDRPPLDQWRLCMGDIELF